MGVVRKTPPPKKAAATKAPTKRTPTTGRGRGGPRGAGSSDIHHDVSKVDAINYCYDRRIAGESYRAIADGSYSGCGTKLTTTMVQKIIDTFIEQKVFGKVESYRTVELDRLEKYTLLLEDRINAGDDKAITLALKISERRSKLLGLDAPVKVDATFVPTALPQSVQELVQVARDKASLAAIEAGELPPDLIEDVDAEASYIDEVIDAEVVEDTEQTFLRLLSGGSVD